MTMRASALIGVLALACLVSAVPVQDRVFKLSHATRAKTVVASSSQDADAPSVSTTSESPPTFPARDSHTTYFRTRTSQSAPTTFPSTSPQIDYDFISIVDTGRAPPDVGLCVGPHAILSLADNSVALHSRNASDNYQLIEEMDSGEFFNELSLVFDAHCVYDTVMQRFVAIAADGVGPSSYMHLAVSKSSDPQTLSDADWDFPGFDIQPNMTDTFFCASPLLAQDAVALYITCDIYEGSVEVGSAAYRIDKTLLVTQGLGAADALQTLFSYGDAPHAYNSILASQVMATRIDTNPSFDTVLVWHGGAHTLLANTEVFLEPLSNSQGAAGTALFPALPSDLLTDAVPWGAGNLVSARQRGTPVTLGVGDRRVAQAVQYEDTLYLALVGEHYNEERTSVYVVRLDNVSSGTPTQTWTKAIQDADLWFSYPALAVSPATGNVFVSYSASGPQVYPSVYYSMFNTTSGNWTGPTPARFGDSSYTVPLNIDGTATAPWGDYATATLDPLDPSRVWASHPYADDLEGRFMVRVFSLSIDTAEAAAPCPSSLCTDQSSCFFGQCPCDDGLEGDDWWCPNNCPNDCSGNGECTFATGECTCFGDWEGAACNKGPDDAAAAIVPSGMLQALAAVLTALAVVLAF